MVTLQTYLVVKLISLWGLLSEIAYNFVEACSDFFEYLRHYFYGTHDTWIFIPGHTFPLSLSNIYNSIHAEWSYDNITNTLSCLLDDSDSHNHYKMSWLSAKIKVTDHTSSRNVIEYDIDEFLQDFIVRTTPNYIPNLYLLFMAWCAYSKHWFRAEDIIEFHVIDDVGNDCVFNRDDQSKQFALRNGRIYVTECDEDNNSDSSSDSGNEDNSNDKQNESVTTAINEKDVVLSDPATTILS